VTTPAPIITAPIGYDSMAGRSACCELNYGRWTARAILARLDWRGWPLGSIRGAQNLGRPIATARELCLVAWVRLNRVAAIGLGKWGSTE